MSLVKFGSIGILNTLFSYFVYWLLIELGVYYLLASIVSYVSGTVFSYIANAKLTFTTKTSIHTFIRFLLVNLTALLFSLLLLFILSDLINIHVLIAQLIVVFVRFPIVYLIMQKKVFSSPSYHLKQR